MKTAGARILAVDDSPDTLEVIDRCLTAAGYRVIQTPGVVEAIRALDARDVDAVITDMRMPRADGLELARHIRENMREVAIVMMTGYASIPGAVEAMKTGVQDYLAKPFTEEELLAAVRRALDYARVRRSAADRVAEAPAEWGLIGASPRMAAVYRAIEKAARASAAVLITGESGTGKELVARAIHYAGRRASGPFVPVNCAAIPDGLLESELFGHRKGAFTGASESRPGFFQAAEKGSIFLDEITELSLPMQAALLRVLQDKEIYMVGSREPRKADVRVLAATNKNLDGLIGKAAFRPDLYYRINVLQIDLPPLREREEDIPLLVRHFAAHYAAEMGRATPAFSDRAMAALLAYPWPGNVRELENVVHRLMVMTEGDTIEAPDLPTLMRFSALRRPDAIRPLAEAQAEYAAAALAAAGGNKSRAAALLGIDRKTLRTLLARPRDPA